MPASDLRLVPTQNVERFTVVELVADTIILAFDLTVGAADAFYFACHSTRPAGSAR